MTEPLASSQGIAVGAAGRHRATQQKRKAVMERGRWALKPHPPPDDATVEDAMERLYFLAKAEEGERQADAGQTVSHEEAKRRVLG